MELASMLAGEEFSDHPMSVCRVIGSFLRSYNDSIDDEGRQDLYACAAKVVGSRGSKELEHTRAERLWAWIDDLHRRSWTRFIVPARLRAQAPKPLDDVVGPRAVRALPTHDDQTHAEVLALIDELLALGAQERVSVPASDPPNVTRLVVPSAK